MGCENKPVADVKCVQKLIFPNVKFSNEPLTCQQLIEAKKVDDSLGLCFAAALFFIIIDPSQQTAHLQNSDIL